ncbi:cytochrome b5 [Sistotremastrum suecicum HHB10207 ss-3]|uniref:Cytochrome b5 n=1 Tax=Sistotremastrum suecicum HHB10207 ss-3 TaxID=1314776 RepID=A0A166GMJ8_9AGAM|nr:cytochrome b5 [Sistotremastrum suecicum HHB10207 ss-3]
MPPPLSLPTPRPSTNSTSLMPPPTTTKAPTSLTPKAKKRVKVALTPGHSMMDWGALKSSGKDLRGVDSLMRVTPSILKQHNKRDDAWSSFNGKVYNITPYIEFHPGGEKELLRVAGRDGTKLFAATHAWVNVDFMLDACLVGFMVSEPAS